MVNLHFPGRIQVRNREATAHGKQQRQYNLIDLVLKRVPIDLLFHLW
jgi:hypothetical protein